jgi:Uma2 family endonuclease
MSLYARHCIPELWVVDTEGKKLHAFRCPTGEMYAAVLSAQTPGVIPIGSLPGIEVDLSPLLR